MRFVDNLTQREIAAEFDVSQMQISRISRRALWKLLTAVNGDEAMAPVPRSDQRPE
jgi:DNA-directed RNA polymerase specialized sigma subunit